MCFGIRPNKKNTKICTIVVGKFARRGYKSIEPIALQPATCFEAYYNRFPELGQSFFLAHSVLCERIITFKSSKKARSSKVKARTCGKLNFQRRSIYIYVDLQVWLVVEIMGEGLLVKKREKR